MRGAIYPGSFDPVTMGHMDIIERASELFDRLVVAVMHNSRKSHTHLFSAEERVALLRLATAHLPNVEIVTSEKLLVELCAETDIYTAIKGLRAVSDFELEFQMALVNRQLCSRVETVFMPSRESYQYLSSSIVKEVGRLGGDISPFVPAPVLDLVNEKLQRK